MPQIDTHAALHFKQVFETLATLRPCLAADIIIGHNLRLCNAAIENYEREQEQLFGGDHDAIAPKRKGGVAPE